MIGDIQQRKKLESLEKQPNLSVWTLCQPVGGNHQTALAKPKE